MTNPIIIIFLAKVVRYTRGIKAFKTLPLKICAQPKARQISKARWRAGRFLLSGNLGGGGK